MSEYQYYEFQAIDRPLTEQDRRALRQLSTRAQITPTSFVNTYEWGNFKGDPARFMERWFDLHLYLTNWGSRRLMIKWPGKLVDRRAIQPFLRHVEEANCRMTTGGDLIVDIAAEEIEAEDWDDGSGWLAALAPLRRDVIDGDLRLFYLLWLTAVEADAHKPDEIEPLPGIGPLTEALEVFATFFQIDPNLLAAASEQPFTIPLRKGRTVAELRSRAEAIRLAREQEQRARHDADSRRRAKETELAHRARLDTVTRLGDKVWQEIENEVERRNAAGYDRAAGLLEDLRTIAKEAGLSEGFSRRLSAIHARHARKARFIERLAALG
jgi:hypothetical protein